MGWNTRSSCFIQSFDIPNLTSPFEQRMKFLQTVVKDRKECWEQVEYNNKKTFPIQFTNKLKLKLWNSL